ncbi:MAG: T9SS type A sorting domain-containing protein [Bacteroidales bacterium]|nr:T9SS type A sorting domain-containing protein [Bacteroidales bacterium]
MKQIAINLYVGGLLLVLLSINLQAQETDDSYIPLINKQESQTWIYDTWGGEGPSSYNRLTMDNHDSVIDGVSYSVVHSYKYDCWHNYRPDTIIEEDFLLREENQKVFVYNSYGERLLYDYSLNIGDTFACSYDLSMKVISIDTLDILINGQRCRKWSFGYYWEGDTTNLFTMSDGVEWIEGLGSTKGLLFYDVASTLIAGGGYMNGRLRCYEYEEELIYHKESSDDCENHLLGIGVVDKESLLLYPNPAKKSITLEAMEDIFIYNSLGQMVRQIPNPKGKTTISISELPKGIYYLKSGDRQQKLIKE